MVVNFGARWRWGQRRASTALPSEFALMPIVEKAGLVTAVLDRRGKGKISYPNGVRTQPVMSWYTVCAVLTPA
jgi:hypothetical protein